MISKTVLTSVLILSSLPYLYGRFEDCSYDESTQHAEYICGVQLGEYFSRRTPEYLYCNNYFSSGIRRQEIKILNFRDCGTSSFQGYWMPIFENLRIFNISYIGLPYLRGNMIEFNKHLQQMIASHNGLANIPADLFSSNFEMTKIDFSFNRITKFDPHTFDNVCKLKTANFSFNEIESLRTSIFAHLVDLEYLDFSNNRIETIDSEFLVNNKKLKRFWLNNNQVKHLTCEFLTTTTQNNLLDIFLNTIDNLETSCINDHQNLLLNVSILSNQSATSLQISNGKFQWIFNKNDFINIRHLNLSSNHLENLLEIVHASSSLLETLDLSNNFLGDLNESTFETFINLKHLSLKHTNMTNLKLETFYHQNNLEVLDISYNNLNKVDFYPFFRKFQHLLSLNLEANNLTEIDNVTRPYFPKLATLGISKNNFSCDYLMKFLLQWHDLKLVYNPSKEMHIGGVDCMHRNQTMSDELNTNNITFTSFFPENKTDESNYDIKEIKQLLTFTGLVLSLICVILFMICLCFCMKKCMHCCKHVKERLSKNSMEPCVIYHRRVNVQYKQPFFLRLN